jgi:hypothetical protein
MNLQAESVAAACGRGTLHIKVYRGRQALCVCTVKPARGVA